MKRLLFLFAFMSACLLVSAQVDLVTLVVSGDGATKDEATKVALRSAIEQAYGAFVSANTEILNDELVKDEIVTVASGNIHGYKELGVVMLPNGNQSVTLQATVSTSKLVAYAQNKGAETEFAGATFGANLRLYEMNKKAEEKALENLYSQLEMLAPFIYDYEIEVGNPSLYSRIPGYSKIPITIVYKANENTKKFGDLLNNTIKDLNVDNKLVESITKQGQSLVEFYTLKSNGRWFVDSEIWKNKTVHYVNIDIFKLEEICTRALFSFIIKDNNGGIYRFRECRNALSYVYPNNNSGSLSPRQSSYLDKYGSFAYSNYYNSRYSAVRRGNNEMRLFHSDFNYKSGKIVYRGSAEFLVPTSIVEKTSAITIERAASNSPNEIVNEELASLRNTLKKDGSVEGLVLRFARYNDIVVTEYVPKAD